MTLRPKEEVFTPHCQGRELGDPTGENRVQHRVCVCEFLEYWLYEVNIKLLFNILQVVPFKLTSV